MSIIHFRSEVVETALPFGGYKLLPFRLSWYKSVWVPVGHQLNFV